MLKMSIQRVRLLLKSKKGNFESGIYNASHCLEMDVNLSHCGELKPLTQTQPKALFAAAGKCLGTASLEEGEP